MTAKRKKNQMSMTELQIQNRLAPLVEVCGFWEGGQHVIETHTIYYSIVADHEVRRLMREATEKARADFLAAHPDKDNLDFEEQSENVNALALRVVMSMPKWEKQALIDRVHLKSGAIFDDLRAVRIANS